MERKDVDRSPLSVLVERIDELGVASVAESIQARSLEEHP
jgi:hypothetical protein